MPKPFSHSSFAVSLLVVLALGAGAAHAEKADRGKPSNIEADALRHDDLKQTSVFTGKVVMTKGTIVLRGARLEVRQDASGYQFSTVVAEPGKRAFFRQKRDGLLEEWIEGEGDVIEYDGRTDVVKFIKRAEMRRLRGATLADQITGDVVVYDNVTDVFTVDSSAANASAANPGGRVRAVLAPKAEPAGAAVASPSPTLRPSVTFSAPESRQ